MLIASVFDNKTQYLIIDENTDMFDRETRKSIIKSSDQLQTKYQIRIY